MTSQRTTTLEHAVMIGGPDGEVMNDVGMRRPIIIRRDVRCEGQPSSARLSFSAYGLVECEINGVKVGTDVLTPGWTVYDRRLPYWTYDVANLLHDGDNTMVFWLADGWYRGRIGFGGGQQDCYGDRLGLIAQLDLVDEDGRERIIATNGNDGLWSASASPIVTSGLYEGETYDARERLDLRTATLTQATDSSADTAAGTGIAPAPVVASVESSPRRWHPVERLALDASILYPTNESTAVRCIGEHQPSAISRLTDGRWLVDFGQNCTQRVVLRIPDIPAGHAIDISHVEVLNPDGTPATRPLRRAVQHDRYIANGHETEHGDVWWEPRFTMHGFRYAVIEGWPDGHDLTSVDLHTRVYSSARRRLGWFSCSDDRVNRLADNVRWSMLSNFVSIPTDCPQRDERFGWTGDIAVFAPTAAYLYDVTSFLDSWLDDVAIETDKHGTVPYYVPYPFPGWGKPDAVALWGDAVTMVPWALYMATGDADVLRRHLELSCRWVDQVASLLCEDGVWDRKPDVWCGQLGDWLDPTAPPDDAARAMTEKPLVATAFAAYSAALVARMLRVIAAAGEAAGVDGAAGDAGDAGDAAAAGAHGVADAPTRHDAARYDRLAAHIRAGFRDRFVRPDGSMTSDTQCAYALAIALDLLADAQDGDHLRTVAGDRLAQLVRERGFVVGTGFAGTPYVLGALCSTGHADEAFSLFLSDRCPSWLYQVSMGATTTWERWDSMLPDGSVNPGDMTSFNHYALGSVLDWMHDAIGGLRLIGAGWDTVMVSPQIDVAVAHGLRSGSATHVTPHGEVSASWSAQVDDGGGQGLKATLDVVVPEDVTAVLGLDTQELPSGSSLGPGHHRFGVR